MHLLSFSHRLLWWCCADVVDGANEVESLGARENVILMAEVAAEWQQFKITATLQNPAYDIDNPYYDSSDLCGSE